MGVLPVNQAWNIRDKSFANQLYTNFNTLSLVLAQKESGIYTALETETGVLKFPEKSGGKQGRRKYFSIGALPNAAGPSTTPHGLTFASVFRIWGTANNTVAGSYLPIPYATATAADIIEIYADNTNIYIVVGKDMSAYTAEVCIEYFLT